MGHIKREHVNEGGKIWVVQPLELIPSGSECLFSVTLFPRQVETRQRHLPRSFSSGSVPRSIPPFIQPPPCLWASFHDLFQQPSEISHINHSHHTIRLTTQTLNPTFPRTCEGDVALLACTVVMNIHNLYCQSSMTLSVMKPQRPAHLWSLSAVLQWCSAVRRWIEQDYIINRQGCLQKAL